MSQSEENKSAYSVGVIGAGQLAKMMGLVAQQMSIPLHMYCDDSDAPALKVATSYDIGKLDEFEKLKAFANKCQVMTYEFEDLNIDVLEQLEKLGHKIYPYPQTLKIIKDKFHQRQFLSEHHLPVPRFVSVDEPSLQAMQDFGFPLVQKLREGGYDGNGVALIRSSSDFKNALNGPSLFEELVDIKKELSVIVARNASGDLAVYDPVEMDMDPDLNLLNVLIYPARIEKELSQKSKDLAIKVAEALNIIGICAVELFLTKDDCLLINEVAPRTHNSGHHTIEACYTSQYEQHLRAVLNFSLGNTAIKSPAVLVNLLGSGSRGATRVKGLDKVLKYTNTSIHLYGKKESRPGRKMGHVTICDLNIDQALEKAQKIKKELIIEGQTNE